MTISGPAVSRKRVLVIDDEPYLRIVLRRLLEYEGYKVVVSTDGPHGLSAAQQERPDAIVLDLMMPVMDGYEVLAQLRTDPRTAGVPVIVLTALNTRTARERVHEEGARACLTKPFVTEQLTAAIASAIENPDAPGSEVVPADSGSAAEPLHG